MYRYNPNDCRTITTAMTNTARPIGTTIGGTNHLDIFELLKEPLAENEAVAGRLTPANAS